MRAKLGLTDAVDAAAVSALVGELQPLLLAGHADHTSFFRSLGAAARGDAAPSRDLFIDSSAVAGFDDWAARWRAMGPDAEAMDRVNPAYIPRNHLVEQALAAATDGDLGPVDQLLRVVTAPYTERPGLEAYAEAAPPDFGAYQTFCGT